MATRPLRQYYATDDGPLPVVFDVGLDPLVDPWLAHRERFLAAVRTFGPADWDADTRCDAWSAREVVAHLVTVDGFWPVAMAPARDGGEPSTFLTGFDPSSSPDQFVQATTATMTDEELLARHAAALEGLHAFVAALDGDQWDRRCESPLGHLPARAILAHGYWDSWLHEFDVLEPRGDAPVTESADLVAATAFSLLFVGLQGGLVDDPDAVGPGPDRPIDACLAFADLPGREFHLSVGTLAEGVRVAPCPADHTPADAGRAFDFVEGLAGRRPIDPALAALPDTVAAQARRASLTL